MIRKYRAFRRARRAAKAAAPAYMSLDCRDAVHGACPVCRCECHLEIHAVGSAVNATAGERSDAEFAVAA